jgi:hypothetical protein
MAETDVVAVLASHAVTHLLGGIPHFRNHASQQTAASLNRKSSEHLRPPNAPTISENSGYAES